MTKSTHYRIQHFMNGVNVVSWFIGLLVCPFVFLLSAYVPYEIPRVWFIHRWIELLALTSFFKKSSTIDNRLMVTLLIFVVVAFMASILGVDPSKSFLGNYWRGDGIITFIHLVGLSLLVGMSWNEEWKNLFIRAIKVSFLCMAIWAVISFILQGGHFVALGFGNPKLLSGWFLISGIIVFECSIRKERLIYGVLLLLTLLLSGGWSSLLLAGIYLAIKYPRLRIVSLLVVVVGITWWWSHSARLQFLSRTGVVYESRERIFIKSIGGALQKPILGWGWSNVDYAFRAYDWPFRIENDVYLDKAHSILLEVFVTTGIVGLFVYILLNIQLLIKIKKTSWFWPLVFFLLHSQTNVISIGEEIYYWIFLGIGLTVLTKTYYRLNRVA